MKTSELMCACKKLKGIVLTEEEKRKLIYRKGVVDWVIEVDWDYFLTLTFKHPVKDVVTASKAVEKFLNNLSSKAYGSRSNKRITAFSVLEKGSFDESLHIHMLIKDPEPFILNSGRRDRFDLRDDVIESWLKASSYSGNPALTSANDEWCKRVGEIKSVAEYMTKQVDPNLDNLIVWDQCSIDGRQIPN